MVTGTIVGGAAPPGLVAFEAEAGTIAGGATIATDWSGYNGDGFVDFRARTGESVSWTLEVQQTGIYAIGFRYALNGISRATAGRPLELSIDGIAATTLPFLPSGDSFSDWAILWTEVMLPAGLVTLDLASIGASGANLDQVLIESQPVTLANTAPTITGALPAVRFAAGATASFAGVTLTDADVLDQPFGVLKLASGAPLPDFFQFDGETLLLTARAGAAPGTYALVLHAADGQAESAAGVAVSVEVRAAAATVPIDLDGDGTNNRRDLDDDNDGLADTVDPFFADASNGRGIRIDVGSDVVLDFTQVPTGAPAGWGFGLTGLMNNGASPEALGLGTTSLSFVGGALHIENAATGTPGPDTLLYGAQFGVDPNARTLTISVLIDNPFDTQAAAAGQTFGLYLGTGNQDDYIRLVLQANAANAVVIHTDAERGGSGWGRASANYTANQAALALADAGDTIRLTFTVDTVTGLLVPSWSVETASGTITGTGAAVTLNGALLDAVQGDTLVAGQASGLAIGIAASSGGATPLDLDVLEFRVQGSGSSGGTPEIGLLGLDASFMPDRLAFQWIDDPTQNTKPDREFKDTGVVRITNSGDGVLDISALVLDGPFKFLDASDLAVRSLAAGATLDVEIGFDRTQFEPPPPSPKGVLSQSGGFDGVLRVLSNDADEATATIDLGGWWQRFPESGREPELNTIFELFGFGNRIDTAQLALDNGAYAKVAPEEVLAPYWKLAPGYTEASVIQLASFKDAGISTFSIHAPGVFSDQRVLLQQDDLYNQSFLPELSDGSTLTKFFGGDRIPDSWTGDDWFGFRSSGNSSDPTLNRDPLRDGTIRGHFVRIFEAIDADGNALADSYLIAVDFNGSNLDYNDTVYLVTGVAPVPELLLV